MKDYKAWPVASCHIPKMLLQPSINLKFAAQTQPNLLPVPGKCLPRNILRSTFLPLYTAFRRCVHILFEVRTQYASHFHSLLNYILDRQSSWLGSSGHPSLGRFNVAKLPVHYPYPRVLPRGRVEVLLHIAAEVEVTPGHGIIGGVEWRVNVRLNFVSYSFNFPNVPGT